MRLRDWSYIRIFAPPVAAALLFSAAALAGEQKYTPLSASVQSVLHKNISGQDTSRTSFLSEQEEREWLALMSRRMAAYMPDRSLREDFLRAVHYEASRAGLDPQMVLGLIEVESRFRKYAVSRAGARGYMQVMPFWVRQIGTKGQDLFHMKTNLRYGCTILRYYLDIEKGNLYRALERYNGSLGKLAYPRRVSSAWRRHWTLPRRLAITEGTISE